MIKIYKKLIRTIRKVIPTALFAFLAIVANGSIVKTDSLHFEILLSSKMLNDIQLNEKYTNSLGITSNRLILLSTNDRFYLLGWGGIEAYGHKVAATINSFAFTTDGFLMTVRNKELCYLDSLGNLSKLFGLPNEGMGISAGKYVMYVYDRDKNQTKYALYLIAKGGKYAKLFEVPKPIQSVVEINNSLMFATGSALYLYNMKSKKLKAIVALPKYEEIKSIAVDSLSNRIYFSTENAIYALKDSSAALVTDKFGGTIRFFNGGLIVFNPEKKFVIRIVGLEDKIASKMQEMKATNAMQSSTVPEKGITETKPLKPENPSLTQKETPEQPLTVQENEEIKQPAKEQMKSGTTPIKGLSIETIKTESGDIISIERSAFTINAISYVNPVKELITFFDYEFISLAGIIQGWNQRIKDSIDKGNQIREIIFKVEKELTDKKNTDFKGYSNEILLLKRKLSDYRKKNKQWKKNMVTDGINIAKELKNISYEKDQSINNKFSDVSHTVKKAHPDPSLCEITKAITITKQKFNGNLVNNIASVTEMLIYYQNEIISLKDIIELWNGKAMAIIKKDSELSKQLEPLKKDLENYKLNPKKNKVEISALKMKCNKIEKERKQAANQMVKDSKELSQYLKQICKEVRSSVKERFNDIIENINYSYQDKF
ncbi:MAG: hypothetical protein ABII90_05510 [Bacteroidota bacterium]